MFTVNTDFPNTPGVVIRPDINYFGNDYFTLTLEWPQFSGETYSVATVPEAIYTRFTTSTDDDALQHSVQRDCHCNTVWTQEYKQFNNILW